MYPRPEHEDGNTDINIHNINTFCINDLNDQNQSTVIQITLAHFST